MCGNTCNLEVEIRVTLSEPKFENTLTIVAIEVELGSIPTLLKKIVRLFIF